MKLITITGPSGAGKDTVARMLSGMTDWPVLCSYTTRPMREGEQDGREHHFVEKCDVPKEKMLAYTRYGGFEYWTMVDQIGDIAIYVIDEVGLVDLKEHHPEIDVYSLYIGNSAVSRLARGVKLSRIIRDASRPTLDNSLRYGGYIHNGYEKTMDQLRMEVAAYVCSLPFVQDKLYPSDDGTGFCD